MNPAGSKPRASAWIQLAVEADEPSYAPKISGDGRHIAFHSYATNLVTDDNNEVEDVFVHDRLSGHTARISVDTLGTERAEGSREPDLSGADGRYVVFHSKGAFVPEDTNGFYDVYLHDRDADENGVYDEPGGVETTRVSVSTDSVEGDEDSVWPYISGDGSRIAFISYATNFADPDTNNQRDVFVHERQTAETRRVSVSSAGDQGNGDVGSVSISSDGRFVGFRSAADNLVPYDGNTESDTFRHDLERGATIRTSVSFFGGESNGYSGYTALSADGRVMAFASDASNLVPFDTNEVRDIFVRHIVPGDINGDRDVDIADFQVFVDCMIGPELTYGAGCAGADIEGDWDVDLRDFAELQTSFGTTAP